MRDPTDLIARLDALAQKATPGRWYCDGSNQRHLCTEAGGVAVYASEHVSWENEHDPAFIAALVTAWPEIRARLDDAATTKDTP